MKLADKLKHMVIEDDGDDKKESTVSHPIGTVKSTPTPIYLEQQSSSPSVQYNTPSPFSVPSTVVQDENVYKGILSKTNFDDTIVGQTVHKYFDALDGTGLDVPTRFRMAMKQAAKLDKVTNDQVMAAFDSLKIKLQQEVDAFAVAAEKSKGVSITAPQNRITEIDDQTARLAQERATLVANLAEAQNSHATITQQFNMASQRRATEIDQQRAQFVALLTN